MLATLFSTTPYNTAYLLKELIKPLSMAFFSSITQSRKLSIFLNITFIFLLITLFPQSLPHPSHSNFLYQSDDSTINGCSGLHKYSDHSSKCVYIKNNISCRGEGYINFLQLFYCNFGQFPIIGYIVLLLWLIMLFYLLGNTASSYFCSSLESLSKILNLPPTIAGVTLLSLGNGAPDFFSSIVSFTRSSEGDVALNSVLGGAFFVSSIVVGIISILVSPNQIKVDKSSFIRDVLFFLLSLCTLFIIIIIGKINLWGSIFFLSIYFFYVGVVSASHILHREDMNKTHFAVSQSHISKNQQDLEELGIPLLGCVNEKRQPFWPDKAYLDKALYVLELPLYLPRRLTIPAISEDKWSKPYAVISATLAPILLAAIFNTQMENVGSRTCLVTYMTASLIGMVLGNVAFFTTKKCSPPKKYLFPWLAGGFVMSVTWTYVIAEELVSLLISVGNVIGVGPSVLGLTVLAWGNSLGDLIANIAMAMQGGADGAQIAISGCYAGPMFNTVVGLGFPLVLSTLSLYPSPYVIPIDHSLYETLGFLMGGLLWALVVFPKKNMRLDRTLGVGLLAIYLCFLFSRLAQVTGILKV